jgi:hypothetical protein
MRAASLFAGGLFAQASGHAVDAEAYCREAMAIHTRLNEVNPKKMMLRMGNVAAQACLGAVLLENGRAQEGLSVFAEAERGLQGGQLSVTRHLSYGDLLRYLCVGRALALWEQGRDEEALATWDRLLEHDGSKEGHRWQAPVGQRYRRLWQAARAVVRARHSGVASATTLGDLYTRAVADPELYHQTWTVSAAEEHLLGVVCASASAATAADLPLPAEQRSRQAERYAALAVGFLERARLAGHFRTAARREHLERAPELDALRQREDFRKLLQAVAAEASAGLSGTDKARHK